MQGDGQWNAAKVLVEGDDPAGQFACIASFASGTGSTTTADTSYDKGDDEIASVKVADDQTVSYGIAADNSAFEQVMRVLKFVANSSTLSSTDITNALSLASSALDATATVRANCRARHRRSNRPNRARATARVMPRRLQAISPASMSPPSLRSCRPIRRSSARPIRRSPRSRASISRAI
jgi:hypothetical protein